MTPTRQEHAAPVEARDAVAERHDRIVAPTDADLANAALDLVGLRPGQSFLDVVVGSGGLSLPAARRGAKVLATDWSPATTARFWARVREEGPSEAEGRVMDAHSLDFDDDTFDVTASRFGVMLVPDRRQALREMVRVTRPGGRVLLIAYASPAKLEALHFFIGALQAVVRDFRDDPADPPSLDLQVGDPSVLRQRLGDAGLRDLTVDTTHVERLEFASGRQMWDWCLGGNPIPGMLVADLTHEQQATMRDVLDGMLRERSNGNGPAVLTNAVNIGIGTK